MNEYSLAKVQLMNNAACCSAPRQGAQSGFLSETPKG